MFETSTRHRLGMGIKVETRVCSLKFAARVAGSLESHKGLSHWAKKCNSTSDTVPQIYSGGVVQQSDPQRFPFPTDISARGLCGEAWERHVLAHELCFSLRDCFGGLNDTSPRNWRLYRQTDVCTERNFPAGRTVCHRMLVLPVETCAYGSRNLLVSACV